MNPSRGVFHVFSACCFTGRAIVYQPQRSMTFRFFLLVMKNWAVRQRMWIRLVSRMDSLLHLALRKPSLPRARLGLGTVF